MVGRDVADRDRSNLENTLSNGPGAGRAVLRQVRDRTSGGGQVVGRILHHVAELPGIILAGPGRAVIGQELVGIAGHPGLRRQRW